LIRAIGDPTQRFSEDRLRMLRAIRFATVLEFEIEKETWNALAQNAASITEISAERIRDELVRIFLSPHRLRGWDLLDQSGLLRAVLPEIEPMKGCEQPPAVSSGGRRISAHPPHAQAFVGKGFRAARVQCHPA
jgi:poly(A) polymerase